MKPFRNRLTSRGLVVLGTLWSFVCLGDSPTKNQAGARPAQARVFAFVINREPKNLISEFRIDGGSPLASPSTFPTSFAPLSEAIASSGEFLYVGTVGGNAISQYRVGANGAMVPLSPATIKAGIGPSDIQITPNGRFLYAIDTANTLSQYRISADGRLKPLSPATIPVDFAARSLAIDPTGRYAYLLTQNHGEPMGYGGTLAQFHIRADGTLQAFAMQDVSQGNNRDYTVTRPLQIIFGPTGHFAYVASSDGLATLKAGKEGILTPVQIPPLVNLADDPGVDAVSFLAFHPSGRVLYTVNGYNNSGANVLSLLKIMPDGTPSLMARYSIQADGTLVPLVAHASSAPQTVGINFSALAFDPTGRQLYAVNFASKASIFQYQIKSDGTLQSLTPQSVASDPSAYRIVIAQHGYSRQ